ncbi:MAG TPA: hypothetical protein VMU81_30255 [Acetobacteraceae bacterium]|jgi:MFS family permease|nr:hypothetical protein [Acetobacteraceae bacterium]
MSQITANRRMVTPAVSLGWFFDAHVIVIHTLSLPLIAAEIYVPTFVRSGTSGSTFLIGHTIRAIGFGACADTVGRRVMPGLSIVASSVVAALRPAGGEIGDWLMLILSLEDAPK